MPPSPPGPPTTLLHPDTQACVLHRKTTFRRNRQKEQAEGTWRAVLGAGRGGGGFQLLRSPGKGVASVIQT